MANIAAILRIFCPTDLDTGETAALTCADKGPN